MWEALTGPWPWYISGPLFGLMVPILLIAGNKSFGISSSLRHMCAAILPSSKAEYFSYKWRESSWNLLLVAGVVIGAIIATVFLNGDEAPAVTESAIRMFSSWNIAAPVSMQPGEIYSLSGLGSARALVSLIAGGFLVGFGTRYANGCTSGHAIMGLSLFNLGSLVATLGFFAGGVIVSNFVLPWVLSL